jgi:hypothetical protein
MSGTQWLLNLVILFIWEVKQILKEQEGKQNIPNDESLIQETKGWTK